MKIDKEINDLMIRELNNLRDSSTRIHKLVKQKFISEKFGEYLRELCLIDFISIESVAFAQQGKIYNTVKSLSDGKLSLDIIASLYFNQDFLKKGIPNYYQSLFDLAIERYQEIYVKCVKILEPLR